MRGEGKPNGVNILAFHLKIRYHFPLMREKACINAQDDALSFIQVTLSLIMVRAPPELPFN